jgi:hypothetical protein
MLLKHPSHVAAFATPAMSPTRQVVFKAVFAAIPLFVLAQIYWAYHQSTPGRLILGFHQTFPKSVPDVRCYGGDDCFPALRNYSLYDWENNTVFCRENGAGLMDPPARLATLTAQFGDPQPIYQRALGSHVLQSAVQQTPLHVLRAKIVDDLWNKPAFILELLLVEMSKPEDKRLEWIFWADRDTVLLDACRSPLSFLPAPGATRNLWLGPNGTTTTDPDGSDYFRPWNPVDSIHLLATQDWNGLNNGIFLLRVNRWAIDLFTGILALRYYRPGVDLPFTEQSAMEILIKEAQFKDNVVWTPQWWFNAYPRPFEDFSPLRADSLAQKAEELHARRGDFLVHFAGRGDREEAMTPWLEKAESAMTDWALEMPERRLDAEIADFWQKWRVSKGYVKPPPA